MSINSFIDQLQIVCKYFDQKTIKFSHSMAKNVRAA